MTAKGSDSSRCLRFDGLSKHFWRDYPPVTGTPPRTLHNTDNVIRFPCWVLAVLRNRTEHYLASPPVSSAPPPPPPLPGWAAAAEPLAVYLCESQQIAVCLCWFITPFQRLLNHAESQNITPCFSSCLCFPVCLIPSAPVPSVLISGGRGTNKLLPRIHALSAQRSSVSTLRHVTVCLFWFSGNQVCVENVRFYSTLTREKKYLHRGQTVPEHRPDALPTSKLSTRLTYISCLLIILCLSPLTFDLENSKVSQ